MSSIYRSFKDLLVVKFHTNTTEMEEVTYEREKSPKQKKKSIENFLIRCTYWVSP